MASSTSDDDIGERPDAARVGPAISSASRFSVTMSTPTIPRARPRARRAITPHVLVGTTTVTGASASSPLAAPMARASSARAWAGRTAEAVSVTCSDSTEGV